MTSRELFCQARDRMSRVANIVRRIIGVPVEIGPDAHSTRGLGNMRLAVATARRGGATAADVVNTRPLGELSPRG